MKHALDIVAEYFSSSDIDEMVRKITQEDAWHALYWLLDACSDLAERAADLFSRDIVKALGGCARQAPKDYPREYGIMHSMYKIYNFTGITAKSYVGLVTLRNGVLTSHRIERELDEEWQTRDVQVASHAVNE